jgi:hypothetical protein
MKFFSCISVILLFSLASCQTLYTYRLPNDSERKHFADSLRWGYSGNTIINIPVVDENGRIYRLPITDKTKIEVKTVYGDLYRFYLRTVSISGDDNLLGIDKTWTGYELLSHSTKSIMVHEVGDFKILSEVKAVTPIGLP